MEAVRALYRSTLPEPLRHRIWVARREAPALPHRLAARLRGNVLLRLDGTGDAAAVGRFTMPPRHVMQLVVRYDPADLAGASLFAEALDDNGNVLTSAKLTTRRSELRRVFFSAETSGVAGVHVRAGRLSGPMRFPIYVAVRPLQERPRPPVSIFGPETVTAALATYPARAACLMDAIDSLVGQVDNLMVYLNQYDRVPEALLKHPQRHKIYCIADTRGNRRAAAKFTWAHEPGYHLLCDDDIIYPPDYAERMIAAIERYGREAIVGAHAIVFDAHVEHWRQSRKQVFRFAHALAEDMPVHLLGTGTVAFHADTVAGIDWHAYDTYPINNDPLLATHAKALGVPLVSVAREQEWMRVHEAMGFGVFEEKTLEGLAGLETEILAAGNPWPEPALPMHQAPLDAASSAIGLARGLEDDPVGGQGVGRL